MQTRYLTERIEFDTTKELWLVVRDADKILGDISIVTAPKLGGKHENSRWSLLYAAETRKSREVYVIPGPKSGRLIVQAEIKEDIPEDARPAILKILKKDGWRKETKEELKTKPPIYAAKFIPKDGEVKIKKLKPGPYTIWENEAYIPYEYYYNTWQAWRDETFLDTLLYVLKDATPEPL